MKTKFLKTISFAFTTLLIGTAFAFTYIKPATIVRSSNISFTIKHGLGLTAEGTIAIDKVNIKFNPEDVSASTISGSAKVESIDTGIGTRDSHLQGEKYFDSKKHPLLTLQLLNCQKVSGNQYNGNFKLKMKGVEKEVPIQFTHTSSSGQDEFNGTFKVNRKDFGVGGGGIADTAFVTLKLITQKD